MNDHETTTRLIAKLAREVATGRSFECSGDLIAALRRRLTQLRVRYRQCDLDDAIALVTTNHPLWNAPPPARTMVEDEVHALSSVEASAILERLRPALPIRTMPAVRRLSDDAILRLRHRTDQARAIAIVLDAIAEHEARVTALERQVEEPVSHGVRG
jgi:hypothetical protein